MVYGLRFHDFVLVQCIPNFIFHEYRIVGNQITFPCTQFPYICDIFIDEKSEQINSVHDETQKLTVSSI